MPDWVRSVVWWQVYPLGFLGADATGVDRSSPRQLDDICSWLDYAVELGVSGLALGPVFQSATHGYDTVDYLRIDERLGDQGSFERLADECHRRGLWVLLDGVFNHVGSDFPMFERALAGDQAAASWFVPEDGGYRTFEGHPGLITLNHDEPEVADFVVSVMNSWLDAGADGWRLDAAYAVPRSFWARVLPRVRAAHPDAYIVGEVIHGDYAAIVRGGGLDSVTQYELWKAIWSSLNDRNLFELAWAMKRHNELLQTFVPLTFVGNHDVTRIASRIADQRHLAHALVLLFTLGGTPSVYYGDEQGFQGVKEDRAGGDDAVRPQFPAGPDELAAYGRPVYRLHQLLIGFRRRHPWLEHAETTVVRLTNTFLAYECRAGDDRLVVALNLDDAAQTVDLADAGYSVLTSAGQSDSRPGPGPLRVPGHDWAIAY